MMKKLRTSSVLLAGAFCISFFLFLQHGHAQTAVPANDRHDVAIFAGGCFWCMEADFEKLPGVVKVESGYTGGHVANPSYQQVSSGVTGHAEAVRVTYDPSKVSYQQLLDYFWLQVDPTVNDRQFCDIGRQYRSGIYYRSEAQRAAAVASKDAIEKSGKLKQSPVLTEVEPFKAFYLAEDYHQDYYKKNPIRYKFYRTQCGRDARLMQIWGKPVANPK